MKSRPGKKSNPNEKAPRSRSERWVEDMKKDIEMMLDECKVISSDFENPHADHEGAIATIEDYMREITGLFEEFAKFKPNCKDWDPLAEKVFQCIDNIADKTEKIYLESDRETMDDLSGKLGCKRYPSKLF